MSKPFSHGIFLKVPYTETEEITKETGKKKKHACIFGEKDLWWSARLTRKYGLSLDTAYRRSAVCIAQATHGPREPSPMAGPVPLLLHGCPSYDPS